MKLYYACMNKVQHRDISPILQKFRDICLGRKLTHAHRYQDELAPRTMPPPDLPLGVTHKLNENYYYTRDVRREVKPPFVVADYRVALESGGEKTECKQLPTPGKVYMWD